MLLQKLPRIQNTKYTVWTVSALLCPWPWPQFRQKGPLTARNVSLKELVPEQQNISHHFSILLQNHCTGNYLPWTKAVLTTSRSVKPTGLHSMLNSIPTNWALCERMSTEALALAQPCALNEGQGHSNWNLNIVLRGDHHRLKSERNWSLLSEGKPAILAFRYYFFFSITTWHVPWTLTVQSKPDTSFNSQCRHQTLKDIYDHVSGQLDPKGLRHQVV